MNNKAVSGVVTAVLLILLVIAAIGILWVVIAGFVGEGSTDLGTTTGCLDTRMKVLSATGSTVTIQREAGSSTINEVLVYVDDVIDAGTFSGDLAVGEIRSVTLPATVLTVGMSEVAIAAEIGDQICSRSDVFIAT